MKCLFCEAEESCFVEIVAWDAAHQRARELLLQGVCTMHARETAAHPQDPTVSILHPALECRIPKIAAHHIGMFPPPSAGLATEIRRRMYPPPLAFGQRYFRLDSPEGGMVRAARDKAVDATKAQVTGPKVEIERVPDAAALEEIQRDWTKRG